MIMYNNQILLLEPEHVCKLLDNLQRALSKLHLDLHLSGALNLASVLRQGILLVQAHQTQPNRLEDSIVVMAQLSGHSTMHHILIIVFRKIFEIHLYHNTV